MTPAQALIEAAELCVKYLNGAPLQRDKLKAAIKAAKAAEDGVETKQGLYLNIVPGNMANIVWGGPGPEPICTCGKPISRCTRMHDDHYPPKYPSTVIEATEKEGL